jgi:hypothetical protein
MLRMSLRTLLMAGLSLAAGLLPPVFAQDDPPPGERPLVDPPADDPPQEDAAVRKLEYELAAWQLRNERDARIGFTPLSASQARLALEAPDLAGGQLAAALYTLGVTGSVAVRPQLRLWATDGESAVRQAAMLGLAELGVQLAGGEELLSELVDDPDPAVAECALLGLLQARPDLGRARVEALRGSAHALADAAPRLLAWLDGSATRGSPALDRRFDLRWAAAKRFGTVDGKAWVVLVLEGLQDSDSFLEELVLHEAARLQLPGVRDHLVELLLAAPSAPRVRAVVRALPVELDAMIGADVWAPGSPEVWEALLDEALDAGVAALMPRMLQKAAGDEALAPAVVARLARTNREYEEHVLRGLRSRDAGVRATVARGVGDARLVRFLPQLEQLAEDRALRVRCDALAARIRLGDGGARATVRDLFVRGRERSSERERSLTLDALHAAGRGKLVLDFIESLVDDLPPGRERCALQATLQLRGRTVDTAPMRSLLDEERLGDASSLRMLEALGRVPDQNDLEFLARTFPLESNRRANLVIAQALVRSGHERVQPLLHAATWGGAWNLSVLAAAVVKERYGINLLFHWAVKPPASAAVEDERRVGFAIGEWGTLQAVDELARRLGVVAGADRPVLQGALLGALAARTQ